MMETLPTDLKKKYTYADYLTWLDDKRREIIDGFVKLMSPAPSSVHQQVSWNLGLVLGNYLKKKNCRAFHAPFDVRLTHHGKTSDENIDNVVQPDISIICDTSKIDEKGCLGAPDMIIEIISKYNPKRDVEEKFALYQRYKVREYWIVHPNDRTVTVFILDEHEKYKHVGIFAGDSKVKVNIFDDCFIDLAEVFSDEP